jgi:predicted nucleic acid-binding Zn ribbon protein
MALPPSLRNRVLAEWRGYREPRPSLDHIQAVNGVLGTAMLALGLGERVQESEVLQAWKTIVGDFIAAHSEPSRLREGVLYVRVLQPTIHFELERVWKAQILEKLKARFGTRVIRELRFRVG